MKDGIVQDGSGKISSSSSSSSSRGGMSYLTVVRSSGWRQTLPPPLHSFGGPVGRLLVDRSGTWTLSTRPCRVSFVRGTGLYHKDERDCVQGGREHTMTTSLPRSHKMIPCPWSHHTHHQQHDSRVLPTVAVH